MRFMSPGIIGIASLAVLLSGCNQPQENGEKLTSTVAPAQSPAERGKYLVNVAGCHDCHSPKKIVNGVPDVDMDRLLSGNPSADKLPAVPRNLIGPQGYGTVASNNLTAWVGPWGVSFAMNLTPDKDTGLGSWTEDMFVKAIKTGKHQGAGRDILPPMPWNWYRNMTDEDLKAVFAYLQSLPPVKNPIPDPLPPDKVPR
jgi:mono/diheme cytochrome c family protein